MRRSMLPFFLCAWLGLAWAAIDLNSADEAQLQTLPGIGPAKARAIIAYREAHGGFRSLDELGEVKGIGGKTLTELKPLLSVGQSSSQSQLSPVGPDLPRSSAPGVDVAADAPAPRSIGLWWGGVALCGVLIIVLGGVMLRRRAPAAPSRSTEGAIAPAVATSSAATPVPHMPAGASAPPRPAGMGAAPATEPRDTARAPRPAAAPPAPPGARGRADGSSP